MTNREKIIEGIKLLKESCKMIPASDCHSNCPNEDICLVIRAVGHRRVYKKMDEDSKIAWNNLTTRYINEHGEKLSKKDLIETRPSLRKKFKSTVKELMEETREVWYNG